MGKYNKTSIGENYASEHRRRRNRKKVVAVLSCFVIVGTLGALTLPAITLSRSACGLEEHQHSPECYGEKKVLTCNAEKSDIHQHTDSCFDDEGNVICHYADFVIHEHDDACRDAEGNLVCTLKEAKEHQHDDSCYQVGEEKIVDAGHKHSDECYSWSTGETPVCGLEVSEGHTHSDECKDENGELICGKEESTGHQHTETCYEQVKGDLICTEQERDPVTEPGEKVLVCDKPILVPHIHGEGCFTVDEETQETYLTCMETELLCHQHSEDCFTTEQVLICDRPVHQHDESCQQTSAVEDVMAMIDALPSTEAVEAQTAALTEAGDEEALDAWLDALREQVSAAYTRYQALTEEQQAEVTNLEKLMAFSYLFQQEELPEAVQTVIGLIDELPDPEQVVADMTAFEEAEDEDGRDAYYMALQAQVNEVYAAYSALTGEEQAQVTNADKLMNFSWLFVEDLGLPAGSYHGEENILVGDMPIDFYIYARHAYGTNGYEENNGNGRWIRVARCYAGVATDNGDPVNNGSIRDFIKLEDLEKVFGAYGFKASDIVANSGTNYTADLMWKARMDKDWGWNNYMSVRTDTNGNKNMLMLNRSKSTSQDLGYAIAYIPGIRKSINSGDTADFKGDAATRGLLETNYARKQWTEFKAQALSSGDMRQYVNSWKNLVGGRGYGDGYAGTTRYVAARASDYPSLGYTVDNSQNPIHYNIDVNLFNYGSGIDDRTNGKVMDFYYGWGPFALKPYCVVDQNKAGQADVQFDASGNRWGWDYYATQMDKTLNSEGCPSGTFNNSRVNMAYLFSTNTGYDTLDGGFNGIQNYTQRRLQYQAQPWPRGDTGTIQPGYTRLQAPVKGDGGLFKVDSEGYYVYDSMYNAASYDYSSERFNMYNYSIRPKYTPNSGVDNVYVGNFLPFNDARNVSAYKVRSTANTNNCMLMENTDLWFGMTVEFDFYMPPNGQINGKDMRFEFFGDDDVWVYIDDVLVLDVGGCHEAQGAAINFNTGHFVSPGGKPSGDSVNPQYVDSYLSTVFQAAGKDMSVFNGNTFKPWTKHTLKFFYMERGGNISYCKLRFNTPTMPKHDLEIGKALAYNNDVTEDDKAFIQSNNYSYKFQMVNKNGAAIDAFKNKSLPLIKGGSGNVWTDGNSCFELKAGQTIKIEDIAKFMGQAEMEAGVDTICVRELIPVSEAALYGSVTVNGNRINAEGPVNVGGVNYYYYQQAINLMADERVLYSNYTNTISAENMGYLAVRKVVESGQNYAENVYFPFTIQLNGKNVPDGTKFLVRDSSGNYVGETESQNGVISIKDGQTAYMKSRLLAGVKYTVTEQAPENWVCDRHTTAQGQQQDPYNFGQWAWYESEGNYDPNTGGAIVANQVSRVTAYNKRAQFGVDIPVTKTYSGAKDGIRTAIFTLTSQGNAPAASMTLELRCNGDTQASGTFHIDYDASLAGTYSYQITETQSTTSGSEALYSDPGVYIVEVKVSGRQATVTSVTRNGKPVTSNVAAFVNLVNAVELPETGGVGTILYTFSGLALICAAALMYSMQRRKRKGAR